MSEILTTQKPQVSSQTSRFGWLRGQQGRRVREAVLAYLLLFPALAIIGLFGLFPLAFSAYESLLKGLNTFLGKYGGLDNYTKAIGDLAYVLAFWIAAVLVYAGIRSVVKLIQISAEHGEKPWGWLAPGATTAAGMILFVRFFFLLLPEVLDIANKVRGQERTPELFNQLLGEAWRAPAVQQSLGAALLTLVLAAVLALVVGRFVTRSPHNSTYYVSLTTSFLLLASAAILTWFTYSEIQRVYAEALEDGTSLTIWSQVVTISAGFLLLLLAWWLWNSASHRSSTTSTVFRLGGAAVLMVGAWVLIGELPRIVAAGDKAWWEGLLQTVYYSVGSIPFQLTISLFIATLLFQNIKGRGLFRLIFFLPYITPTVAAAAVFRIFFSGRATAPVNSLFSTIGLEAQLWLSEPAGIFSILAGAMGIDLPAWAGGPSMAMVVIILFSIWTFVGFDVVIFLAGLGSIPAELYEAASIDGAGRGAQFRHITLPLLSPTIYFLTLWATIGTFKAFNHIWVLRSAAALGTADTASVVIFNEFKRNTRYGYASALSVVLLIIILALTLINNRIASKRVFYG